MKLKTKICIGSFLLFITVFILANIMTICHNREIILERTLQQAVDEQESISSGIVRYVWSDEKEDNGVDEVVFLIREYLDSRVNSIGTGLLIQSEGKILYNTLEFGQDRLAQIDYAGRAAEYSIQEIDGKYYLVLTSLVPVKELSFYNIYVSDISGIYADQKEQFRFFIRLAALASILFAAGMYLLTGRLTRTLRKLMDSAGAIASGNYKERIGIKSKDEIGMLSESYNKMADAVEETVEALQKKNEEQQRFIDNFTHELRTSLTAVVGYADLLRSTSGDEAYVQELGDYIFREGKRIEKMSEVMMDLIFLRRHVFDPEPCDLTKIVLESAETWKPVLAKDGITLNLVLPQQPQPIAANTDLLSTLFGNLIDNARKASKEGSNVWLRVREEGDTVTAEIEDEGRGIPKEDQPKVFESFYMVDKTRNRSGGVGLGLSICADIAKIHQAQIELVSEADKGTVIRIKFPRYK